MFGCRTLPSKLVRKYRSWNGHWESGGSIRAGLFTPKMSLETILGSDLPMEPYLGILLWGEERFLIEWDRETDQVYYDILAFSNPNHILSHLSYPFVRRSQKQFGRDSATSMFNEISTNPARPPVFQTTN